MRIDDVFPYRVVSGFRPTRSLHIGHYAAVVADLLHDQYAARGAVYVFVADHHARSKWDAKADFVDLGRKTVSTARGLLALGINPDYWVLYKQSDIPELFELMWFFAGLLGEGWLRKGHALKAERAPTVGVYLYPLLMVSDILSLKASHAAIGNDQRQHLELARQIAKKLSSRFGPHLLPIPESLKLEPLLVSGTDSGHDGGRKMAPEFDNEIPIFAEEDIIQERIERIVTRSIKWGESLPIQGCNIIQYAGCLGGVAAESAFIEKYSAGSYGYSDAKQDLRDLFFDTFSASRRRGAEISDKDVTEILAAGTQKAREQISNLLFELRDMVQGD